MSNTTTRRRPGRRVALVSVSFESFLATYRAEGRLGDPISDLGRDFRDDPDAPSVDAELVPYLEKMGVPEDVLDEAWLAYLAARAC